MKGSQLVGLYELFTHAQKVILLVGGLLHDVEESVLHDYLGSLQELLIKEKVFVVGVVSLCLALDVFGNLN